jgi:hypothetical protein
MVGPQQQFADAQRLLEPSLGLRGLLTGRQYDRDAVHGQRHCFAVFAEGATQDAECRFEALQRSGLVLLFLRSVRRELEAPFRRAEVQRSRRAFVRCC